MKFLVTLLASGNLNFLVESYKSVLRLVPVKDIEYDICIIINTLNEEFFKESFKFFQGKDVIFLRTESNGSPGKGHNSVITNCKTYKNEYDYFLNIDGDDFLYPTALLRLSKYVEYKPDALFLCFHDQLVTSIAGMENVARINYENGALIYNFTDSCSKQWFDDKGVNPFKNDINKTNTPGRIILLGTKALELELKYDENVKLYDDYYTFMQLFEYQTLNKLSVFGIFDSEIYVYNRVNTLAATKTYTKEKAQKEEIIFRNSILDKFLSIRDWNLHNLKFLRLDQTLFSFKREFARNLLESIHMPTLETPLPPTTYLTKMAMESTNQDFRKLYLNAHPLNELFERVFVINNDTEKRQRMTDQLTKLGIDFQFVQGIDAQNHIDIYQAYLDKPQEEKHPWETERNHQMIDSPESMGLLLTWQLLLEMAMKNNWKNVFVLQDECIFDEDFNERIGPYLNIATNVATTGEKPWEMLMLGSKDSSAPTHEIEGQGYYKGSVNSAGGFAVGINSNTFEKYHYLCQQRIVPCDFTDFDKVVAYPNLVRTPNPVVKNTSYSSNIIITSFSDTVINIVDTYVDILTKLGKRKVVQTKRFLKQYENCLHIVFFPNVAKDVIFPKNYIVIQLEQLQNGMQWNENYKKICENATQIIDYSDINKQFLENLGIHHVTLCPPSFISNTVSYEKPIDVLIYGYTNSHKELYTKIKDKFPDKCITLKVNEPWEILKNTISKSKVVVHCTNDFNKHSNYSVGLFLQIRVMECLQYNCKVLTEYPLENESLVKQWYGKWLNRIAYQNDHQLFQKITEYFYGEDENYENMRNEIRESNDDIIKTCLNHEIAKYTFN